MPRKIQDQRVPIMSIASAPRLLAAAGIDARAVASCVSLDPGYFDEPLRTLSFQEMGRYLSECMRATGDDSFSLRVGLAEGPSALTTLGFLMMNTATVGGALTTLAKFLHQFGGDISVTHEKGLAMFTYDFRYPEIFGALFIVDAAMGLAVAILRALCGPSWSPVEAHFTRAIPSQPGNWKRNVQAPVYFGTERNLIVFSARWLDQPIERADPTLRQLLLDKIAELEAQGSNDFPARVGAIIRSSLLTGDISLGHVADRLAISTATLKRHLRTNAASFSALVDQTRMDMACQLLGNSTASMTQIAEILGYSHASTFTRAFSRLADMSPREWRTRHRNQRAENA